MQPLEKSLRNALEKTVKDARDIAESAARAALEQLGVRESAPYSHLSPAERELRRKLRIHGRQLGDIRDIKNESQEIDRLIEEVAYEHWHRMLFARFLAENDLLMLPDGSVSVSLKECEDLAAEEGARNGWEVASRYAAKMLPQIFRPDSPVFELVLPPEYELKLEKLVANLPSEIFKASDSLGWVYQFWQAKKKDGIDAAEGKIGARELPVVTQLFTEPYMVHFLLDNSIGAWWAGQRIPQNIYQTAKSEEDLRQFIALPGVPLEFLRFIKDESGCWAPAAGKFDSWPKRICEIKILDPCCGSGHFLVATLLMLVAMRMEAENISIENAVESVLKDNIHGLEIDARCIEIAAFALALTAWCQPKPGSYRPLPELNLACSGFSINAKKEEWLSLAGNNADLQFALENIYDQFINAPLLGSLIDPKEHFTKENLIELHWNDILPLFDKISVKEQSYDQREMGVVAQGLTKAATLLAGKYQCVVTNVPYLARGKQSDQLKEFCATNYSDAKNDLATVFLDRCLKYCAKGGTINIVIPQNWLFLTSYKKFRQRLLKNDNWHIIGRLGYAAFEIMDWWAFNTSLIIISQGSTDAYQTKEFQNKFIAGIDASTQKEIQKKINLLRNSAIHCVLQTKQIENPDSRVILTETGNSELLFNYCNSFQGISPADFPQFGRTFWESYSSGEWRFWQSTVNATVEYKGRELLLWFDAVKRKAEIEGNAYIRGQESWGKKGVVVSAMGHLPCTLFTGQASDTNVAVLIPKNPSYLPPIWCYCSSSKYYEEVRQIDQSVKVTNATLVKVPFDLEYWTKVAAEIYPNGLPKPYSDDPTQWIFHGHPLKSDSPLQVAMARLLGFHWPAELDPDMELSEEQRACVNKCETLYQFEDDDGIVCIPSIRGEPTAADRLLSLLAVAYGDKWSNDILSQLLVDADHEGKTLETWLRDKFFSQHCKIFQNRPFIWQIWDGLRDGFSVLVNYHKLDHKKLQSLIYNYLGDWINRQKHDITQGIDGAQEKLDAAETLKKRLELILQGEAPYDIFVRWKPLEQQPIGWSPDLNDGVRLNIRPFMSVPDIGKKGAGVLREKPNIKWEKDRGQDVESTPWYHLFKGDRINDHHLTLAEKKRAQGIV